jgi:hypothetical protein
VVEQRCIVVIANNYRAIVAIKNQIALVIENLVYVLYIHV